MANTRPLPSKDYLWECFDYDPLVGTLIRKSRPEHHFRTHQAWARYNTQFTGKPFGCVTANTSGPSYVIGNLSGEGLILAHRIIFKMMTGEEPPPCIDHRDRDGTNNRWDNIRVADDRQSSRNKDRKPGSSGVLGVFVKQRKKGPVYIAKIMVDRKTIWLGTFPTPETAHAAYVDANRRLHGEFSPFTNRPETSDEAR